MASIGTAPDFHQDRLHTEKRNFRTALSYKSVSKKNGLAQSVNLDLKLTAATNQYFSGTSLAFSYNSLPIGPE